MWKIDKNKWEGAMNLTTKSRYDENGIDKHGFNEDGIHVITGTLFDENGYDRFGFNEDGINKYGINKDRRLINGCSVRYGRTQYKRLENRMHILATDKNIYSLYSRIFLILKKRQEERIFDANEIDQNGFYRNGMHVSNYSVDNAGYNALGFGLDGYDREGYDIYGFDKNGYDEYGYNLSGRDMEGYDREGYDGEGYNRENLNRNGEKRIEEKPSEEEIERKAIAEERRRRNYLGLKDNAKRLSNGEMSLEEYVTSSKTSIEDLIDFAKKQKMGSDVIRGLYKYIRPYKEYKTPFYKNEYLKSTIIMVNGEEVRPTEEDVDRCIEYLKTNGSLICDKTVREVIRKHLRGEIDITIKPEEEKQREVTVSEVEEVAKGVTLTTTQNTLGVVTNLNEEQVINNDGQSHNDE